MNRIDKINTPDVYFWVKKESDPKEEELYVHIVKNNYVLEKGRLGALIFLKAKAKEFIDLLKNDPNPDVAAIKLVAVDCYPILNFKGKQPSSEWVKNYPVVIIDARGWDLKNFDFSYYQENITEEEFKKRLANSKVKALSFK